jgi:hypothetical protein
MSAFAFAETCVFGKQSLEPVSCGPLTHCARHSKLLGHPFFRRYGVNLPSSLTEVRSLTWGGFSLPTCVGLRYGQNNVWLAAFLGGLGIGDFRPLAEARASCHGHVRGLCLAHPLQPGSPSCPFDGFTFLTASPLRSIPTCSGAGFSDLLAIAYDYDVLGLGPDSPWVDCRCPGTLRHPVCVVLTRIALLIPAFALVRAPPVLAVWLPCCA